MKTAFRVLLIIAAIFIGLLVFRSIMRPEKYKTVYETRKNEIRDRLVTLRAAQAVYKNEFKTYASDIDSLVDFVQNGHVTIVKNVGNIPENMTEEAAFKAGLIRRETTEVPAKEKILELDPNVVYHLDDFQYIPFNKGKKFTIQTGSIASRTYEIPVYRIDVPIEDILASMDESITPKNANFLKRFFNYIIYNNLDEENYVYPPIHMGSLTEANTSGSWE